MKKIILILMIFSLIFWSLGPVFVLPVKTVQAASLSTSIFPSSISGMQLGERAMQTPQGCYAGVAGFGASESAVAIYQSASGNFLAVNISKYNTSGSAENIAKNCTAQLKAQIGSSASWQGVKTTTVSGYKTIYDIGTEPGYGSAGIMFVVVNEYLLSVALTGNYVSESDLKSAASALVSRIPQEAPPSGKSDGSYCTNGNDCNSGYCYNNTCCASGKECCAKTNECREAFYCDTSAYYCVQKKVHGSPCSYNENCQSNWCGDGGGQLICCVKGPIGVCCKSQSDCGASEYCFDYGCRARNSDGSQCGYDYECKSDYCEGGKCKTRPVEKAKFNLGRFCKRNSECSSGNCSNGVCCEKGKDCCTLNSECEGDKGEWWQCKAGYCFENVEAKEIAKREKARKDGYCAADESCYTPDCEYTVRCGIDGACEWGGSDTRSCVGCIASIASELNIVVKVVDIIQGIGCDVLGNLISGLLGQSIDKVYSALVSVIYVAIDIGLELNKTVALAIKIIGCIDGYFGLSKTFLIQVAYALIDAVSGVTGNSAYVVALQSPAGLIVQDENGRSTGISAAGLTHDAIPNSVFIDFPKADVKMVFLTDTKGEDYSVIARATEAGTIDLAVGRSDGVLTEKIAYNNIEQNNQTETTFSFSGDIGFETPTLRVDKGGGTVIMKSADEVSESEVQVPDKFKAGGGLKGFFGSKFFKILIGFIVLSLAVDGIRRLIRARKAKWAKIVIIIAAISIALLIIGSILFFAGAMVPSAIIK